MSKKILVINGNPILESFNTALAEKYIDGAKEKGAEVRLINLAECDFDPILEVGYRGEQPLESDLQKAKEDIEWADHIAFVYPIWWGGVPALLKGFIDRVFLPGFAFKFEKGKTMWEKLLKGRSADLLVTMDTPPLLFRWMFKRPAQNQMKYTTLKFCGIDPVRIREYGSVKSSKPAKRQKWLKSAEKLGYSAA